MGETNEVEVTNREKDTRILTLKVLDSVELPQKPIRIKLTRDDTNDSIIKIYNVDDNWAIYSEWSKGKIGKLIVPLFATKGTVIGNGSSGNRIRLSNPKSGTFVWKEYQYAWENICHIGDVWFLRRGDVLVPLGWAWLYNKISSDFWIVWIECNWEIILRKFGETEAKYWINSEYPYITLPGTRISQLDKWSSEFFIINEWNVDKIVLEDLQGIARSNDPIKYKVEQTFLFDQFGEIQQIESDKNDNFVLIVWKKDGISTLYVLKKSNRQSGEVLVSMEWVKEFLIMPDNTLLWIMEDWTVKSISTTFDQFEKWYIENGWDVVMREEAVRTITDNSNANMIEAIKSAELKEWESWIESRELAISEQDVISEFWSKEIPWENKTIRELFDEAKTPEEIRRVEKLVNKILVSISSFQWGLAIKNHIKGIIIKKKEEIILHDFQEDVNSTEDALNKADNFQDLISVKALIDNLHERRKSLHWGALAIDLWKKIQEMRVSVEKKIAEYQKEGKEDLLSQIQKNIYWSDLLWFRSFPNL